MTELDHRVRGVDHAAFPTFDPAATVRFYRDVLGFPVVHSICAAGWGPEDHPDFIHFFFDIGNDDRIAFFYYFGLEPVSTEHRRGRRLRRVRPGGAGLLRATPATWRSTSTTRRTCWSTGAASTTAPGRWRCRSSTRPSSRSTPTTRTATCSSSPGRCGRSRPQEDLDANLTIDALLDVVGRARADLGKLLARKAELIVERAAAWELTRSGPEAGR